MEIRKLTPQDAAVWRQIRLEGLKAFPDAFLTQYCDVVDKPLAALAEQLRTSATFVAFDGNDPVASMGYLTDTRSATRHRATIVAVYVRAEWHGKGVADGLLQAVLDDLPPAILQIHLEVAATNPRARAFYARHGFKVVGTIPRAIFKDGVATDDHMMVRMLDA